MKPHTFRRSGFTLAVSLTFAISAVLASVMPSTASAQEHRYRGNDTLASNSSAEYSYSGGDHRFGLGVMTSGRMTPGSAAVTGWVGITPDFGIQPFVDIAGTSPFSFGVGALGKYTLTRTSASGFHVGGGLSLGSIGGAGNTTTTTTVNGVAVTTRNSAFAVGIAGFFGFHFLIPGTSNIVAHVDAGGVLTIVDGNANFVVESVSPAIGFSLIYLF